MGPTAVEAGAAPAPGLLWRELGMCYSRDRMCLATCWGLVKVAWHTGHLWSPAMADACSLCAIMCRKAGFLDGVG